MIRGKATILTAKCAGTNWKHQAVAAPRPPQRLSLHSAPPGALPVEATGWGSATTASLVGNAGTPLTGGAWE